MICHRKSGIANIFLLCLTKQLTPNKENLSVVIRFLDSTKTVREEFVGFYLCEDGTTGAAIKDLIIGAVADLGLSMDDSRSLSWPML